MTDEVHNERVRKAHYGRPAKATGRLLSASGTAGPSGQLARARRFRAGSRLSRHLAPTEGRTVPDHVREPAAIGLVPRA